MGTASNELDEIVHRIACQPFGEEPENAWDSEPLLRAVKSQGSELWIDTGDLELAQSIWKQELTALTTNNTLANQVVQSGVMDDVIKETIKKLNEAGAGLSQDELIMEIGFVINCRIALRLVDAFRVRVSVELHPNVARDISKSLHYARRYFNVCRSHFIVKLPLTPEGYLAVRKLGQEDIPVNFTLGFSARQNYLAARLSNPKFVNVFLGRLNAVVSDNQLGTGKYVGEKVTMATQREINDVKKSDASIQTRLIAASIRNGDQVADLAGVDVLTIPPKAMESFIGSERTPEDIRNNVDQKWEPGIYDHNSMSSRLPQLWEVSRPFKEFCDKLLSQSPLDRFDGKDLVAFCDEHGMDLFYPFSQEELETILNDGKIPKMDRWPSKVAVDDLMTQSALQSFSKDQAELDDRIRSFL